MAKPNYAYAKRQRDIAKKQKKEEKRQLTAEDQQQQVDAEGQPVLPDNDVKIDSEAG